MTFAAHKPTPPGGKDMTGIRVGRLTVLGIADGRSKGGELRWRVRCDCGAENVVRGSHLRKGATHSCGCLRRELGRVAAEATRAKVRRRAPIVPPTKACQRCNLAKPAAAFPTHYLARDGLGAICRGCLSEQAQTHGRSGTPEWIAWQSMLRRCEDPQHRSYPHYGARGIRVCERWHRFEAFFADMGPRPKGLTLERCDVDGDYEPHNCCWATLSEQARNRRSNHLLTYAGETMCLAAWAERLGMETGTLYGRIKEGWSTARAIETPVLRRAGRR